MNKRQWKKKYKKEYGCNPPSSKQIGALSTAMKRNSDIIRKMHAEIKRAMDIFSAEMKRICNEVKRGMDVIQNMPEDEFEEKISQLTLEQQALARKVRGRKEGD